MCIGTETDGESFVAKIDQSPIGRGEETDREDGLVGLHIDDHSTHSPGTCWIEFWCRGSFRNPGMAQRWFVGEARFLLPHRSIFTLRKSVEKVPAFSEPLDDRMRDEYTLEDERPYKRIPLAKTGTSQSLVRIWFIPSKPPWYLHSLSNSAMAMSRETLERRMDEIEFRKGKDGKWRVFTKQYLFGDGGKRRRTPSSLYTLATTVTGLGDQGVVWQSRRGFPKADPSSGGCSGMGGGRSAGRTCGFDIWSPCGKRESASWDPESIR